MDFDDAGGLDAGELWDALAEWGDEMGYDIDDMDEWIDEALAAFANDANEGYF